MKIKKSEIIWNITKETALSIIIALVAYILLSRGRLKKVHKRRRQNSAHLLCGNACALYHRKSVPAYRESVDIYFLLPVCDFTEYPDTRFK